MHATLVILFWACLAAVVYTYLGYPVLICILSRLLGRANQTPPAENEDQWPTVTLLIVAHNEEDVIEQRLHDALASVYPRRKLLIVVASDGSTDATAQIVRRYAARGVRLLDYVQRRGKAATLNSALCGLTSDIVVFSDANTSMDVTAINDLIRWFTDPSVGVVCGRLLLTDSSTGRNADGVYWKYETFLKRCEGRLGALLGSNGGIYAVRRTLYNPIPDETIIDDFAIPLLAKLRTGCRIIYDADAVAYEQTAPAWHGEFERRTRIGAGGFQAITLLWKLLDPRCGWIACAFFSHKILRWLSPLCLGGALLASLLLLRDPVYRNALFLQLAFYAGSISTAAMLQAAVPKPNAVLRIARAAQMFTSMNAALLVGFVRWVRGRQTPMWQPTARLIEARAAA